MFNLGMFTCFSMDAKEKVKIETNKEKIEKKVLENEDQPEYQEKIPDQPRIDSTFAAGLLGNILAGWGISVGSNNGSKKKKKEEEGVGIPSGPGVQTIIVKQPLEIITRKPDVLRVDPITGKDVKNDGSLG